MSQFHVFFFFNQVVKYKKYLWWRDLKVVFHHCFYCVLTIPMHFIIFMLGFNISCFSWAFI